MDGHHHMGHLVRQMADGESIFFDRLAAQPRDGSMLPQCGRIQVITSRSRQGKCTVILIACRRCYRIVRR